MKRILRAWLAALALAACGNAFGQTVTYTFSGTIDGSVAGVPFVGQAFTFTVTGNLATVQNAAFPYSNVLTSGTITIAGTACAAGCTMTTPGAYVVFNEGPPVSYVHGISTVGNIDVFGQTLLEACYDALCGGTQVNDNLASNVAPTSSVLANALAPYASFATSGGAVIIGNINGGALVYAVSAPAVVIPTLSEWGLILLAGLTLVVGLGVLRQRPPLAS